MKHYILALMLLSLHAVTLVPYAEAFHPFAMRQRRTNPVVLIVGHHGNRLRLGTHLRRIYVNPSNGHNKKHRLLRQAEETKPSKVDRSTSNNDPKTIQAIPLENLLGINRFLMGLLHKGVDN